MRLIIQETFFLVDNFLIMRQMSSHWSLLCHWQKRTRVRAAYLLELRLLKHMICSRHSWADRIRILYWVTSQDLRSRIQQVKGFQVAWIKQLSISGESGSSLGESEEVLKDGGVYLH